MEPLFTEELVPVKMNEVCGLFKVTRTLFLLRNSEMTGKEGREEDGNDMQQRSPARFTSEILQFMVSALNP